MKRIITLLVLGIFLFGSVTAYAAESRAVVARPSLSFDGTTAICQVSLISSGSIDITLSLWQGNTLVKEWNEKGSNMVAMYETCSVTKGKSYSLTVSGTAGGETVSGSVSGRCS